METSEKLQRLLREFGKKRTDLIKSTGASKSTVSTWFSGRSKPSWDYLPGIRDYFKCDLVWLLDDKQDWDATKFGMSDIHSQKLANQDAHASAEYFTGIEGWDSKTELPADEVELPFFTEVEAAAGNGMAQVRENHGPKLRFSKSTLKRYSIDPSNAACIKIKGNSMEPVLPDGATIGVDLSSKNIIDGKMYAIDHDGMLRVKMLYRLPGGGIRLRSYNLDEHPDEKYSSDEANHIRIIGKVFWSSVLY